MLDSDRCLCYDVTDPVTDPVIDPEDFRLRMDALRSNRSRVNIRHVAHEAGVSAQTVSRVLNNRPDVAAETRQRVQDVITKLGYRPSALARGLSSQRTRTLGLITADFSDYFFTQVIAGAEAEARQYGYRFMLGSTERNPEDEPEYIRLLTERHVDGILFARPSTEPDHSYLVSLLRDGVPVVTTAYHIPGQALTVIDVDNIDGGQQATRCLLERGHDRVAMITGPASWKSAHDRTQGYMIALEAAGVAFDPGLIAEADWSIGSGYRAAQQLLARERPFSALFVHNDQMAIGALRALREAGRRVPADISVVGYDDIPIAEYCEPRLTTIRQPMREVGAVATRLLIQAVEKPGAPQGEILLKTELVVRDSCAQR
jgi:LacI family transcriptional regulator